MRRRPTLASSSTIVIEAPVRMNPGLQTPERDYGLPRSLRGAAATTTEGWRRLRCGGCVETTRIGINGFGRIGRNAFNPAGGLHHAGPHRASGFCVYNDVAVSAAWLRDRGHRVACVDVDAHHGDGTQVIFFHDPDVLTISLHESGRYLFPGTGFPDETGVGRGRGTSANLPLQPFVWDEPWLAVFEAVVPPLLREFQPTVLLTQDGCDTHALDPLTHMQCSTATWPHVGRRFHELAHELCDGRWVALGGGSRGALEPRIGRAPGAHTGRRESASWKNSASVKPDAEK
jgi:acetoin utilization deacetylase AcuC-like enzyme